MDPIVIDPPDFDQKAAWGECRKYVMESRTGGPRSVRTPDAARAHRAEKPIGRGAVGNAV